MPLPPAAIDVGFELHAKAHEVKVHGTAVRGGGRDSDGGGGGGGG
eukprot:CAMPEP_0181330414 /NCGR_PEP_ID=MMETSP1101-20121128/23888_1 /TAXON_ID=46948 /ORGANISM="Rhodomonas abbreviata, Strain Caron Lab Isolate" /LENGTH=44 /DNA_ID= /DNA_START= /DNA_END= /DNA_ORIENTATION=